MCGEILWNAGERGGARILSRSGVGRGTGIDLECHDGTERERINFSRRASPSGVRMLSSALRMRSASFCGGGGGGRCAAMSSVSTKPISGSQSILRLRADGV